MKLLEFEFKGDRKYIHGPDIFNRAYKEAEADLGGTLNSVKLSCRSMAKTNLFWTKELYQEKEVMSIFDVENSGLKTKYYLYAAKSVIENSYPYFETDIIENSVFDYESNVASIKNYDRYSVSEISVALLKELCKHSISNSVKWIFVGLDIKFPIELFTLNTIEVEIEKNIGTKMVVAILIIVSKIIGNMKFSSHAK